MSVRRGLHWLWGPVMLGLLGVAVFVFKPLPPGLLERGRSLSLRIEDRNGLMLRVMRTDSGLINIPLPLGEIPPQVSAAFVASEDKRFGTHPGVDPLAMVRAVVHNIRAQRVVSGASTITQQLARQLVPRPRTLLGKAQEALWALRLTAQMSSKEILRAYLDRVPLGNGAVGVEAAAQEYFGRGAKYLSVGQAALLAGVTRAPEACEPRRHLQCAMAHRERVLEQMVQLGFLTHDDARREVATPIDLLRAPRPFKAPHFTHAIARDIPSMPGVQRVRTTLDAALQHDVEETVREQLGSLRHKQVTEAAVIVIDNNSPL